MKYLMLILLFPFPCFGQWKPVYVSSNTDAKSVQENFRRASIWSNRKLDKFSNDTIYGQPVFSKGIEFADGTVITSTGNYSQLNATQTFTGQNTFIATSTTTFGWAVIGSTDAVKDCATATGCQVSCPNGYRATGGGCGFDSAVSLTNTNMINGTDWYCACTPAATVIHSQVLCARVR